MNKPYLEYRDSQWGNERKQTIKTQDMMIAELEKCVYEINP
jgi:hypothetical protein